MRPKTIAMLALSAWWLGGGCGPNLADEATAAATATQSASASGTGGAGGMQEEEVNGCTPSAAVDMTGQGDVTIAFGGTLGNRYDPACVTVDAGTTITFSGDSFQIHPLSGGVDGTIDDTSPIPFETTDIPEASVTLDDAGDYPYFCLAHVGVGMEGVIYVR